MPTSIGATTMIKCLISTAAALVVACAVCATGATNAFAEEKTLLLPNAGGVFFKIKTGESFLELVNGNKVTCKSSAGEGTSENGNLGKISLLLTTCSSILETVCTSEGSARGLIHLEAEIHFILALLTEKLVAAIVLLFKEIRFSCAAGAIDESVKIDPGCIAGQSTRLNALVETLKTIFKESRGVQGILEILPPEAAEDSECKAEAKIGSGRLEQAALEGEAAISGFVQEERAITALFMNPEGV
jgi:hypothetical protein